MSETVTSRRWNPRLARVIDIVFATIAVLLLLPLMLGIALTIRLGGGPVLFAQVRPGRNGVPFHLHKFRTLAMVPGGASVAPANDARATALGRMLRRWHVDELPQLIDVLRGKMALVGPRPEVPSNLEAVAASDQARLHAVRPGVTGPTQLAFLAEDELLAECDEPTRIYRQVLVPAKACEDLAWLARRTLIGDLRTLITTPYHLASRRARDRSRIRVRALIAAAESNGSNRS
mgnify:FL=1|tara:strand:+ start:1297 stop:1995 length:699 start_codon:yes stop_codon:yes gene_type:complete